MSAEFVVPDVVRRRAESLGSIGREWLGGLDADIHALEDEWGIAVGRVLHGGTEALVAEATMAGGEAAVLKVGVPGSESGRREATLLLAAKGRAYARVFRHDAPRRAMLIERLGPRLDELGLSVEGQIEVICSTLKVAWQTPPGDTSWTTGAEKAASLAAFIMQLWEELGRPCPERVIERALSYAGRRAAAFSPETSVLAHGDAHSHNLLRASTGDFRFIDPDGLWIEPAYDLSACMRGWSAPLLAGDAAVLGHARARLLAQLTGADEEATWEWGFIERVSTGLLLTQLGEERDAAECLAVADRWAVE